MIFLAFYVSNVAFPVEMKHEVMKLWCSSLVEVIISSSGLFEVYYWGRHSTFRYKCLLWNLKFLYMSKHLMFSQTILCTLFFYTCKAWNYSDCMVLCSCKITIILMRCRCWPTSNTTIWYKLCKAEDIEADSSLV